MKFNRLRLVGFKSFVEPSEFFIERGLTGIVERENGAVLAVDDWGMRDLAYPVKKHTRGNYVRLEYAVAGAVVAEIERIVRITDGIFKFVTVLLDDDFKAQGATA